MNAIVMRNRYARVVAVAGARRIESDRQRGCRWKMLLMRRARESRRGLSLLFSEDLKGGKRVFLSYAMPDVFAITCLGLSQQQV